MSDTGNTEKDIFFTDPLVVQALGGKLTFAAFKSAAEAKDGSVCEKADDANNPDQPLIPFAKYKDSTVRLTSSSVIEPMIKIAADYHKATGKTLTLTDGDRTALEQAYLMIPQIVKGKISMYSVKDAAAEVKRIYDAGKAAGKPKDQIVKEIGVAIQNQVNKNVFISRHLRNKGVDVRFSDMKSAERLTFKKIVIKNGGDPLIEDDHFHLQFQ